MWLDRPDNANFCSATGSNRAKKAGNAGQTSGVRAPQAAGVRVGTDIESVADVAAAIEGFGLSYLGKVFTSGEIEAAGGSSVEAAPGLAARFAAKEATVKVLRPHSGALDLRTIEVCREPGGWCRVELSAESAALATAQGLHSFEVSLSHGAGIATATVVALVSER